MDEKEIEIPLAEAERFAPLAAMDIDATLAVVQFANHGDYLPTERLQILFGNMLQNMYVGSYERRKEFLKLVADSANAILKYSPDELDVKVFQRALDRENPMRWWQDDDAA